MSKPSSRVPSRAPSQVPSRANSRRPSKEAFNFDSLAFNSDTLPTEECLEFSQDHANFFPSIEFSTMPTSQSKSLPNVDSTHTSPPGKKGSRNPRHAKHEVVDEFESSLA